LAAAGRHPEAVVTYFDELEREPWRFDFLDVMRRVERSLGMPLLDARASDARASENAQLLTHKRESRPRIGDSGARKQEVVLLRGRELSVSFGQDPWLVFPASNISELQWRPRNEVQVIKQSIESQFGPGDVTPPPDRIHLVVKFLGLLGAQGALPLATTEETHGWLLEQDSAFAHFLDVFNNRFLQLFYRAWADSRPIVQHDRRDCDRFNVYVNSVIGIGSAAFAGIHAVPRGISLYAGILGPQAKSASRLRSVISGLFDVDSDIEQLVGSWLTFDESERTTLGRRNSVLSNELLLGEASFSLQDKIRVRLNVENMDRYRRFLPYGADCQPLADLIFFYIGDEIEWDVELALLSRHVSPVRLGEFGELGWTSWMSPNYAPDEIRCDACFNPAERARHHAKMRGNVEGKTAR
jgi:type VI secretion system protein ImpH